MKEEIIKYLRHIGDDFDPDDVTVDTSPECEEPSNEEGLCPAHKDCGICRYEYMLQKGWLKDG